MVQRTVLKVDTTSDRSRKKYLQAVSGIQGVDTVEIDANKGTLVVTGNADPYEIIMRTQKIGKFVEVVSVGPPALSTTPVKPSNVPSDGNKKPDEKKPEQKPQAQAQPQAQPKAQPQTQVPSAQPQAQVQHQAQFPTQAHSHIHTPNACPVCQHMYTYQWPRW